MKRSMGGGAHRSPVHESRQRRTIRLMQGLLVLVALGLFVFAVYSAVVEPTAPDDLAPARSPSPTQVIVPVLLGAVAVATAFYLGGPAGARVPTPARLDELAGRAEEAVAERARRIAEEQRSSTLDETAAAKPGGRS